MIASYSFFSLKNSFVVSIHPPDVALDGVPDVAPDTISSEEQTLT
jgi:hypothetical protein